MICENKTSNFINPINMQGAFALLFYIYSPKLLPPKKITINVFNAKTKLSIQGATISEKISYYD